MKSETAVDKEAALALSQEGCRLMRNNVGAFQDKNGQWVRYGLANESKAMNTATKSSDRIGWTIVEITPEMVGRKVAVFTAIEMKKEGYKPSGKAANSHYAAQQNFCNTVKKAGGIAGIIDSAEKGVLLVRHWLQYGNS